jgi:hypothetical protein
MSFKEASPWATFLSSSSSAQCSHTRFTTIFLPEGSLNKSLHALAKSFPAMLCQMSLNVAMLRFRAIFLA